MKTVIIHPERCVGCFQCRIACAVEHSQTKSLTGALLEAVRPQARLRVFPGRQNLAFPNKCRHCDPAPCQQVCIAGAISRAPRGTVQIDPDRCINCAMCAMACPFGVLSYAATFKAPEKRAVALKCDPGLCPGGVPVLTGGAGSRFCSSGNDFPLAAAFLRRPATGWDQPRRWP
jgi:carbon-monoxide dehydrogenase iron sulfur subunit